jgi:hypothetical protein
LFAWIVFVGFFEMLMNSIAAVLRLRERIVLDAFLEALGGDVRSAVDQEADAKEP